MDANLEDKVQALNKLLPKVDYAYSFTVKDNGRGFSLKSRFPINYWNPEWMQEQLHKNNITFDEVEIRGQKIRNYKMATFTNREGDGEYFTISIVPTYEGTKFKASAYSRSRPDFVKGVLKIVSEYMAMTQESYKPKQVKAPNIDTQKPQEPLKPQEPPASPSPAPAKADEKGVDYIIRNPGE
jgi:hypothetical protein